MKTITLTVVHLLCVSHCIEHLDLPPLDPHKPAGAFTVFIMQKRKPRPRTSQEEAIYFLISSGRSQLTPWLGSVGTSFLACRWLPCHSASCEPSCVFAEVSAGHTFSGVSPLSGIYQPLDQGLTLMTSFNLNYLEAQIQSLSGVRLQHMNWYRGVGKQFSPLH